MTTSDRLTIHTARISYSGEDRLDVTAKSAPAEGKPFAPTWPLVKWGLSMREQAKRKLATREPNARSFNEWWWKIYRMRYEGQMEGSGARFKVTWDALLKRERVVLVCYCTEPERCHRSVLAELLAAKGAYYAGEIGDNNQEDNQDDDDQRGSDGDAW
jgi:hypothetical protein